MLIQNFSKEMIELNFKKKKTYDFHVVGFGFENVENGKDINEW